MYWPVVYVYCNNIGETSRYPGVGLYCTSSRSSVGHAYVPHNTIRNHHESRTFFTCTSEQLYGRDISLCATFNGSRICSQVYDRSRIGCTRCQIESYRKCNGMRSDSTPTNRQKKRQTSGEYIIIVNKYVKFCHTLNILL